MIGMWDGPAASQILKAFQRAARHWPVHSKSGDRPAPFALRLSFEERAVLEAQAGDMPLAAYIRDRLLNGREARELAAPGRRGRPLGLASGAQRRRRSAVSVCASLTTVVRQVAICIGRTPGKPEKVLERMKRKIDTEHGGEIGWRVASVDPVFGNLRYNKGLDRFTLRERNKVDGQWKLYCLVHNIEKLANNRYIR